MQNYSLIQLTPALTKKELLLLPESVAKPILRFSETSHVERRTEKRLRQEREACKSCCVSIAMSPCQFSKNRRVQAFVAIFFALAATFTVFVDIRLSLPLKQSRLVGARI